MRHFIFLACILFSVSANSRLNTFPPVTDVDSIFSRRLTGETFMDLMKYNGNQYINDDWVEGDILLSTGEKVYGNKIKYNGLLDEVIWLNSSGLREYKLDKQLISEFWYKNIRGESIHFKKLSVVKASNNQSEIFAEVAAEGKVSLYIQRRITKVDGENRFKEDRLYAFDILGPEPLYYIKLPSNNFAVMSKITRNSFLKLFPTERKSIIKVLNKNHVNFKTESSVVRAIELINNEIF